MWSAFSTTMFAFAGATSFPTIQSDMKDRRQFFTAVLIAMAGNQGEQRDVVYLVLVIESSYMSPNAGEGGTCGVSANEKSCIQDLISC